jgi:DNA-binding CsgD family transcriptional regulator
LSESLVSCREPLEFLRGAYDVDRVSLARIDLRTGRFEIAADAGAKLLAPGTTLPLNTCSYFAQVSEGRPFYDDDFDRSKGFDRPVDGVILASGFHSGCSVPLRDAGEVVGAISLSTSRRGQTMADIVVALEPLGEVLAAQILRLRIEAALRALRSVERERSAERLTPREQELLGCLDEGLRFKQIAARLAISESTAKTHARHLFRKLDVNSRAEAVHAARTLGLLA